ncbi:EamA family transporter [Hyphomicrobium sp. NDB2Meth4]|uniref:EamA family transporter n=1 Tax=Hyphomicrobium sp. NDB2Meth4 TaxID=1892846 RepID=UPI000931B876|nr:EamA family transporter [Hyphomicrobium sp. NDB2Meth4]
MISFRSCVQQLWIWAALIAIESAAQISLKLAANQIGEISWESDWLVRAVSDGWFIASLVCDVAGFLVWIALLRRHDLSFAVPVSSLCFVLVLVLSVVVLNEPVSALQIVGMATIGVGIYLVAQDEETPPKSPPAAASS